MSTLEISLQGQPGKVNPVTQAVVEAALAGEDCEAAATSSDGKTIVAVTPTRLIVARDKAIDTEYALADLHSISALGGGDNALLAPLRRGEPFAAIQVHGPQRLATAVRQRLVDLHAPGDEWWDDPAGDLGVSLWPAGLLVAPTGSVLATKHWYNLSFVNTGVQFRSIRAQSNPSLYPGDLREFIPWDDVHGVTVEGADQIERRPSVGAVVAFGVLGLGASKAIRRSYAVVNTTAGDYVVERQDMLPTELRGFLAPVLRRFPEPSSADGTEELRTLLAETNRLLNDILEELRSRG